jgi:chromosome segregation ATPase
MVTVDDFLVKLVNEQNDSDKKFKEARDQFQKEVGVHTFGGAPRELKAEHKKALSELNETRERIQGQINDARALRKDLKGKLRELRANKPVKMTQKSVNKTNIDIGKAKVEEVKGRLDAAKARLNAAKAEHDVIAHQFHINTFDTALLVKLAKDVEGKIKALHGLDS